MRSCKKEQTGQTPSGNNYLNKPSCFKDIAHLHDMKRITQFASLESLGSRQLICPYRTTSKPSIYRCLHTTLPQPASVEPVTASGPPPAAPVASAEHVDSRVARRRKQAELLKRGQDLRAVAGGTGGGTAKQKRFWKDVHVRKVDGT